MTASVQTKTYKNKSMYHVVLRYKDSNNKWCSKWVSTHLVVNGRNKRKAESMATEIKKEWETKLSRVDNTLFSNYLRQWLQQIKGTIADSTYSSYVKTVERVICPYFDDLKVSLADLKPYHIQSFYAYKMTNDGVSASTIHHYQANISKALNDAMRLEIIDRNPASVVMLPKKEKNTVKTYTAEELSAVVKASKGTVIEPVVKLDAWLGARRGEIIGLKWDCIDFESRSLSIVGVMSDKGLSGTKTQNLHYVPSTKTKASRRTFPLTDEMVSYLINLKREQDNRKTLPGYNHQWDEFVCAKPNGDLISPDYFTHAFPKLCEKCGLNRITPHAIRHTNVSLLLNEGASMKELQEWAGHSTYNTTADIYSHLQKDAKKKLSSAITSLLAD